MTLADKLRDIIAKEAANRGSPTKACPMDKDGKHKWQKPWARWAQEVTPYMASQNCACGAAPPPAAYPEI